MSPATGPPRQPQTKPPADSKKPEQEQRPQPHRPHRPRRFPRLRLAPSPVGKEETWRDWLKGTYALIWYLVGLLAACSFALITLKDRGGWPYSGLAAVAAVVVVGGLGLRRLWTNGDEEID